MRSGKAEHVDFVFGDFDNFVEEPYEKQEDVFRKNVVQATRSLFWLMMCQRIIPGADPDNDNWAQEPIASNCGRIRMASMPKRSTTTRVRNKLSKSQNNQIVSLLVAKNYFTI